MEAVRWVDLSTMGRVRLLDRDRYDLVHRLSTNDILKLQPGEGCATVFTSSVARLLDCVVVLNQGETGLMITNAGKTDLIRGWLQRNVFFTDRFQSENVSDEFGHIGVMGSSSAELLDEWLPGAAGLPTYKFLPHESGIVLVRTPGDMYWLIGENLQNVKQWLAEQQVAEASSTEVDVWRIENGLPGPELTDDYIPLELGLWDAVSFNKGCYIGQEIIARMESRGKLAKMLMKIRLSDTVAMGSALQSSDGKAAGTVTSVTTRLDGQHIGLAVVKSAYAQPDQTLHADNVVVTVTEPAGVYEPTY